MDEAFGRLVDVDPELSSLLAKERDRQANELQMIAAENYVFAPVMEALDLAGRRAQDNRPRCGRFGSRGR